MSKRILVIDDNEINLRLAASTLMFAGFEVVCAAEAESALQLLGQAPVDLIVMDVSLPGIDGLQLTQRLKADPVTRSIPVIVVTASATKEDERRALAAGADGFVTKPINTRTLPQTIRGHLDKPTQ